MIAILLNDTNMKSPGMLKRWFVFNVVGGLGVLVQLAALLLLTGWMGLNYLLGTGLAVEVAVLHNFVWHEQWTWAERAQGRWSETLGRLLRFHMTNGLLSMMGNLILMRVFIGEFGMNYAVANVLAIVLCSILNFFAGDRLVFMSRTNAKTGSARWPYCPAVDKLGESYDDK
jgi:putative flippase GtrA